MLIGGPGMLVGFVVVDGLVDVAEVLNGGHYQIGGDRAISRASDHNQSNDDWSWRYIPTIFETVPLTYGFV